MKLKYLDTGVNSMYTTCTAVSFAQILMKVLSGP